MSDGRQCTIIGAFVRGGEPAMKGGVVRKTRIVAAAFAGLSVGSAAAGAEYAWQVAGSYGQDDAAGIVDSSRSTLDGTYYPAPVDDTRGPYDLAPFLTRSSYVTVGTSWATEETMLPAWAWGTSPTILRFGELYSRYTSETSGWSVAGRYVWRESGWFAGGGVERGGTEESTSVRDVHSSGYRVVGGKYLGDATTLEVTVGTNRDRQDPDEVVCTAFARRCYGLVGADVHTDEAGVSIRHVGELWDRAYSVGADVRSSRSDHLLVSPRLLDPEGRPFAENPFTQSVYAVEEGGLLYSNETQVYNLSAAWYPTPALRVRLSYLAVREDYFSEIDADGVGLSAGWFFRRKLSAEFSFTRTRLEHGFGPDSRDSDTASIRLLGRF